jgi:hypothetical protein
MLKDSEEWHDLSESYDKHITNKKEEKQLEERKLIEEADIQLSKELFQDNTLTEKNTDKKEVKKYKTDMTNTKRK